MSFLLCSDFHSEEKLHSFTSFLESEAPKFDFIVVNGDITGEFEEPRKHNIPKHKQLLFSHIIGPDEFRYYSDIVFKTKQGQWLKEEELIELGSRIRDFFSLRYDFTVSTLKEISKFGHVVFNLGNHESPYSNTFFAELAFFSGMDPNLIHRALDVAPNNNAFNKFTEDLINFESHSPNKFTFLSNRLLRLNGFHLIGIPGFFHMDDGSINTLAQREALSNAVRLIKQNLSNINNLVVLNHTHFPYFEAIAPWSKQDNTHYLELFDLLSSRSFPSLFINSHHHLVIPSFFSLKNLKILINTPALNGIVSVVGDDFSLTEFDFIKKEEYKVKSIPLKSLNSTALSPQDQAQKMFEENPPELLQSRFSP